ncbi:uncharacterized protein I303_101452 [Kwoniella dejecticola CBS 10117]|uniref:Uncharacterized protein n=1 Tax=Kwoniella dejecticola CBS 10117 TaxID=1296121 RepID=A0AAJ8KK12_9TREE
MLDLKVRLYQSPIYLSTLSEQNENLVLSGSVDLYAPSRCVIPGLDVVFAVTMEKRNQVGGKWSKPEVTDYYQAAILHGNHQVYAGSHTYEFSLLINRQIPYSRITHFDRVAHSICAIIPQQPPSYLISSTKTMRKQVKQSFLRGFSPKVEAPQHPITCDPIVALASQDIQVYGPKHYLDDGAPLRWDDQVDIPGIGSELLLRSDQNFVSLGSALDISLTLRNLPPDLTLHSWSITLHQVTEPATGIPLPDPAPLFRDVYIIGGETNLAHLFVLPGRERPKEDTYLWRGPSARKLDRYNPSASDGSTDFNTTLHTRVPSPVIGAIPSCTGGFVYASIQHTLCLTLHFSVLGEDLKGVKLPNKNGTPVEGAIRAWTYERPIHILSDLHNIGEAPTPIYSKDSHSFNDDDETFVPSSLVKTFNLPHMASMTKSKVGFLRPVGLNIANLEERIRDHWQSTAGLCACFDELRKDAQKTGLDGVSDPMSTNATCNHAIGSANLFTGEVEYSNYDYLVNETSTYVFLALFCFWWTIYTLCAGAILESIGWGGRYWSAKTTVWQPEAGGIWDSNTQGFIMQIVCLIIAPTFFSAANYILLGNLVTITGSQYSSLTPTSFSKLFTFTDFLCLLIQCIGGGMVGTATTGDGMRRGLHVMAVGVIAQIVVTIIFSALLIEFIWRWSMAKEVQRQFDLLAWTSMFRWRRSRSSSATISDKSPSSGVSPNTSASLDVRFTGTRRSASVILALVTSNLLILARSLYRASELTLDQLVLLFIYICAHPGLLDGRTLF